MPEITAAVTEKAIASLTGYGFETDAHRKPCSDFQSKVRDYLQKFCAAFEADISAELRAPTASYSEQEMVSWTITLISEVWHTAMGRFRDKLLDRETLIAGPGRIKCETATNYIEWLVQEIGLALAEKVKIREIVPNSSKFRKKRKQQSWLPYPYRKKKIA